MLHTPTTDAYYNSIYWVVSRYIIVLNTEVHNSIIYPDVIYVEMYPYGWDDPTLMYWMRPEVHHMELIYAVKQQSDALLLPPSGTDHFLSQQSHSAVCVCVCVNLCSQLGSWIGFTVMTQCVPVAFFTLVAFIQMSVWAKGKHRSYLKEFRDYPTLRSSILPFIL